MADRHRCEHEGCVRFTRTDEAFCSLHGGPAPIQPTQEPAPRRINPDPASRRTTAAPEMPVADPEIRGAQIARLLMAQESQARFAASRRGRQRLADGEGSGQERVPMKVFARRNRPDATVPVDPVTMAYPETIPPGNVLRWVRTTDWMGRPSEARIAEFEDYGYEVALDAAEQPIETRLGVLMHAAPENYALRANDKTPVSAINRDDALVLADELAETANRVAGSQVASVTVEREHGSRQVTVEAGKAGQFGDDE